VWYLNGKLHREDGPAVERANGYKEWRLNDKLHREDGPAVEYASGTKEWYLNGKRHREDGPAVERASGDKMWFLDGQQLTEDEHWLVTPSNMKADETAAAEFFPACSCDQAPAPANSYLAGYKTCGCDGLVPVWLEDSERPEVAQ
jgi:hypothetical protein